MVLLKNKKKKVTMLENECSAVREVDRLGRRSHKIHFKLRVKNGPVWPIFTRLMGWNVGSKRKSQSIAQSIGNAHWAFSMLDMWARSNGLSIDF